MALSRCCVAAASLQRLFCRVKLWRCGVVALSRCCVVLCCCVAAASLQRLFWGVKLWRCRVVASCCVVALLLRLSSVFFAA